MFNAWWKSLILTMSTISSTPEPQATAATQENKTSNNVRDAGTAHPVRDPPPRDAKSLICVERHSVLERGHLLGTRVR